VVQVEVEDLLLRQVRVDLVGENRLFDLAQVAFFRGQIQQFGHLLRDRAAPLYDPSGLQILVEGARHALEIEALVVEETRIFRGDKGLDHDLWHVCIGDDLAVLGEEFIDEFVVVGIDAGCQRRTVVLQRRDARQLFEQDIVQETRSGQDENGREQAGPDKHILENGIPAGPPTGIPDGATLDPHAASCSPLSPGLSCSRRVFRANLDTNILTSYRNIKGSARMIWLKASGEGVSTAAVTKMIRMA